MTTHGNVGGDVRPHSVEQHVEWFYAFDIHCNAFFVVRSQELLLSCVAQTGLGCFPNIRLEAALSDSLLSVNLLCIVCLYLVWFPCNESRTHTHHLC